MNLLTAIPKNVRLWLYVIYAVAGPVLLWTKAHGWTGQTEIDLWVGLGTALGLTAAANLAPSSEGVDFPTDTKTDADDYDPKHDR